MKFSRSFLQLICLLLTGWVFSQWAEQSVSAAQAKKLKVATINASSEREMTDHLADDVPRVSFHEAIVAPTVSHQTPFSFCAIIPTLCVWFGGSGLIRQRPIFYYYSACFRHLFGHEIAINAP